MALIGVSFSLATAVDGMSAPMAPGGVAAFDSEGRLLSVLAAGNQVLILDTQARVQVKAFTASVPDVCALALDGRAGRVAVGAPDGCIALHDVSTGVVVAKMTMTARSMAVLAFSPSGSLLASGDDDVVGGGIWAVRALGRMGWAGRLLRFLIVAAGASAWLAGSRISLSEPTALRHLAARWLPDAATERTARLLIPYPVWLGIAYVMAAVLSVAGVRWLHTHLHAPRALTRRRRVLGDSLLHALLDVAYQAQVMANDAELAAYPRARVKLLRLVQLAAGIAAREWVRGLRSGSRQADRIIRDQGSAISAAIRRWDRPAALAGAQLPALSNAFAEAVVNAQTMTGRHWRGTTRPCPADTNVAGPWLARH
jgi:hypothetical protein